MNRAYQPIEHYGSRLYGGVTFFPYQLSLGLTLRWPPAVRLYLGPFKIWMGMIE